MVYIFSMVCGVLVLRPEIKPTPFALEVQSLNHWPAREIPEMIYFYLNLGSCSTYCLGVEWAGGWNLTFQKRCPFILPLKWWEGQVLVSPTLQTFHSVIRGFHGKDLSSVGFMSVCWGSGDVLTVWPCGPGQLGCLMDRSSAHLFCALQPNREKAEARAFFQDALLVSGCYLLCSLCGPAHLSPSPGSFWNLS